MRTPLVQLVALDPLGARCVRAICAALSHVRPALEILVLGTADAAPSRARRVERLVYSGPDAENELASILGASLSRVDIAIGCATQRSCQTWLPKLAAADAGLNCPLHCVLRVPPFARPEDIERSLREGLASVRAVSTEQATVAEAGALVTAQLCFEESARNGSARSDFFA